MLNENPPAHRWFFCDIWARTNGRNQGWAPIAGGFSKSFGDPKISAHWIVNSVRRPPVMQAARRRIRPAEGDLYQELLVVRSVCVRGSFESNGRGTRGTKRVFCAPRTTFRIRIIKEKSLIQKRASIFEARSKEVGQRPNCSAGNDLTRATPHAVARRKYSGCKAGGNKR